MSPSIGSPGCAQCTLSSSFSKPTCLPETEGHVLTYCLTRAVSQAVHRWHHLWLHAGGKHHHHHDKGGGGDGGGAAAAWQPDTSGANGDGKYHAVTQQLSPATSGAQMSSSRPPLLFCQPRIVPSSLHDLSSVAYGSSTVTTETEGVINVGQASTHSGGANVGDVSWMDAIKIDAFAVSRKRRPADDTHSHSHTAELGGLPIAWRGKVELGSSTTGTTTFAVNFDGDKPLAAEPIVLVHPRMQKGGDPSWQDVYVAEVQTVSTTGFTANVARLDKLDNSGWGQQVRLDYIAFPSGAVAGAREHERYRAGEVNVGKSHGKNAVRISVSFSSPFSMAAAVAGGETADSMSIPQVRVLCSPRNQPHHDYTDVHSVVVHETWASGFNATVSRVDRLGESWGSNLMLGYVAVLS